MGFGHSLPRSYRSPDTESVPKMDCGMSECIERTCTFIMERCSQSLLCVVHREIQKRQNRGVPAGGGRGVGVGAVMLAL